MWDVAAMFLIIFLALSLPFRIAFVSKTSLFLIVLRLPPHLRGLLNHSHPPAPISPHWLSSCRSTAPLSDGHVENTNTPYHACDHILSGDTSKRVTRFPVLNPPTLLAQIIDFLTDIFFLMDILLNFRTAYFKDDELIDAPAMIVKNVRVPPPHLPSDPATAPPLDQSGTVHIPYLLLALCRSTCDPGSFRIFSRPSRLIGLGKD